MWAERYILVTAGHAGADAGRDAEKDVAIEDEWIVYRWMEDNWGAGDRVSCNGWSSGGGSADGGRSAGTVDFIIDNNNDDSDDNIVDIDPGEDRTFGSSDLCQSL